MTAEGNMAIVRREVEELYKPTSLQARRDPGRGVRDLRPDRVLHDPGLLEEGLGPGSARRLAVAFRSAFPDLRTTLDDAVAEGTRWPIGGRRAARTRAS